MNIVLSGGSTKAPLHYGFLQALQEKKIKWTGFAGTSAGSIVASYMALGHSLDELFNLIINLDFSNLLDRNSFKFFSSFGLFKGDKLLHFLDSIFESKKMKDSFYPLSVFAHCLNDTTYKKFNTIDTPEIPIALAVRASCSIPFFFNPVKIDGNTYVDGGVSKNFAIDVIQEPSIGHLITSSSTNEVPTNFFGYLTKTIDDLISSNVTESIRDIHDNHANKKIIVSIYDYPATSFNVPLNIKRDMIKCGYVNTISKIGT